MFNLRQLAKSFSYALKGLSYVYKNEQNFRIQIYIAIVVLIGMVIFRVTQAEAIVLFMLIIFVLVLELANSVVEKMIDVLKPRLHIYVKVIKDMMAAAVLISALGSALIAALIFVPRIIELISQLSV